MTTNLALGTYRAIYSSRVFSSRGATFAHGPMASRGVRNGIREGIRKGVRKMCSEKVLAKVLVKVVVKGCVKVFVNNIYKLEF